MTDHPWNVTKEAVERAAKVIAAELGHEEADCMVAAQKALCAMVLPPSYLPSILSGECVSSTPWRQADK
jgi:hypothetical protein